MLPVPKDGNGRIISHNSLDSVQGGKFDEAYHMTQAQWKGARIGVVASVNGSTVTVTLVDGTTVTATIVV